jgi:hypothetical protein
LVNLPSQIDHHFSQTGFLHQSVQTMTVETGRRNCDLYLWEWISECCFRFCRILSLGDFESGCPLSTRQCRALATPHF